MLIYYWDERDGPNFTGWWFGPKVGGDQVWSHAENRRGRELGGTGAVSVVSISLGLRAWGVASKDTPTCLKQKGNPQSPSDLADEPWRFRSGTLLLTLYF